MQKILITAVFICSDGFPTLHGRFIINWVFDIITAPMILLTLGAAWLKDRKFHSLSPY